MRSTLLLLAVPLLMASQAPAQNSRQKIRPAPSETAQTVGQAIPWRSDLEAARKESAKERKPVVWYVHTLEGSFMDRSPELDRYVMGGPFSWPWLVELMQEEVIPVRAAADAELRRRFDLEPIAFIEPGLIVLAPGTGRPKVRLKLDRIQTYHPGWFRARLAEALERPGLATGDPFPGTLVEGPTWMGWEDGPDGEASAAAVEALRGLHGEAAVAEARWLAGAGAWDRKQEELARAWWTSLRDAHPAHPLAAKAALELDGQGPYVRGFESYVALPEALLTRSDAGSQMAAAAQTPEEARRRAVELLLRLQRADGSWSDSWYDFGGTDSLPNVHLAVTALAARALHLHRDRVDEELQPELMAALARAEAFLRDDRNRNLEDSDEIVWAELYRLRHWLDRLAAATDETEAGLFRAEARKRLDDLLGMQEDGGAWAHEYPNPFVTAAVLVGLARAQAAGLSSDALNRAVQAGLDSLEDSRSREGAYSYGLGGGRVNTPFVASVGRSPIGEFARTLWSREKAGSLGRTLRRAVDEEEELFLARKYDDHTSMHAYGGFFFWFALEGRAEAIAALPEGARRERLAAGLTATVLDLPEVDGGFLDSHELGRSYGTAMALLTWGQVETPRASD